MGSKMKGKEWVVLVCMLFVCVNTSPLYVLVETIHTFGLEVAPVELLKVDVTTNATISVKKWTFSQPTYVIGTAFDQERQLYWMAYNFEVTKTSPNNETLIVEQSGFSALNVSTGQFHLEEFELGRLIGWDIDINSSGDIEFLSRAPQSRTVEEKNIVDYCVFLVNENRTVVQQPAALLLSDFGTVAYLESEETMLILTSDNQMLSYSKNLTTISLPAGPDVRTQIEIAWNINTNTGYLLQTRFSTQSYLLVKYEQYSTRYPIQCEIQFNSHRWWIFAWGGAAASIDPTENYYSFVLSQVSGNKHRTETSAIYTLNLDTCEQYVVSIPHGKEFSLIGPEYAYKHQ